MATTKEVIWIDDPVRMNMPVPLDYTFKNSVTRAVINLSTYDTVKVQIKKEGVVYSETAGSFVTPSAGTVTALNTFTEEGVWQAQFYCYVAASPTNKLWGQPVQFRVAKNIEDAELDELLPY